MPLFQYTVRDQTGQTRSGVTSSMTEVELRGRLEAEGFHIVTTQLHEEEKPLRVFQYTVTDAEGETRSGTLSGRSEAGIGEVLEGAGYTVVRIVPAVKTWVGNTDGDAYRGYVATAKEVSPHSKTPPLTPAQQVARLQYSNRLLLALAIGLAVLVCALLFVLSRQQ